MEIFINILLILFCLYATLVGVFIGIQKHRIDKKYYENYKKYWEKKLKINK
jgi:hypothetical protein